MYTHWWIFVLGAVILLSYSVVYLLEWKHPNYLQYGHVHSASKYRQGLMKLSFSLLTGWLFASYLFGVSKLFPGLLYLLFPRMFIIRFLMGFALLDLTMYAWHRINHVYSPLWNYHRLHHEEKQLNVFSTFQFHPKEILLSTAWRLILLPLLGIEPAALLWYHTIFFSVILFHHSNIRLSRSFDILVASLIVSPDMHHVHHSVNIDESNSNYGSVFSFWDRIFRSHKTAKIRPITFGVS